MNYKTIYKTIAGSHLYGTSHADSDMDIRGVCLPPMTALLGLSPFEQHEPPGEDTVIYSLRKFARLALKANPNILEMLFVPDEAVLELDCYGKRLLENRHLFLSTRVVHTYSGYAFSQLKRIEGHRRWLLNPPIEPTLGLFGGQLIEGQAKFPNQQQKQNYKAALREWKQFETWRKNRNPARAELEAKYGYDVKHAGHLVRLMCQAQVILAAPETFSARLDGWALETVMSVMRGEWEYEHLIQWAKQSEVLLKILAEHSRLPKKPPFKRVEWLVMEMLRDYLNEGGKR